MDKTLKTQSLLPWLDPGTSKIHLEVSLQNKTLQAHNKIDPSFQFLDSSSPLFHLLHASFNTPSGKSVKEVFLLVQKDHCSFTEKSIPFNNPEIDKIWLRTSTFDGIVNGLEAVDPRFSGSDNQEDFALWKSLFYCEKRQYYFHPPCPQCGNLLELCVDDGVLAAAGLSPYSTTLERYLFCPSCQTNQLKTDFFSYDKDGISSSPAKNRRALVDGFEQLVKNGLGGEGFPCQRCTDQSDCYGSGHAFSRIRPFAFYPFRMLVTDVAQLPAQEYISMLSGATCSEILQQPYLLRDPGRAACVEGFQQQGTEGIQLFFEKDARRFLEVLYLKIALLEQIARTVLVAHKHLIHPDLKLSIDQFWVELPRFQGLLPYFWNFKVKPIALGLTPLEELSLVSVPQSLSLYSLALLWFNTLLVNREQSAVNVHHALASLLNKDNGFEIRPDFFASSINDHGAFGPGNIFWFPAEQQLPPLWLDFWQRVLGLGWSLLQTSYRSTDYSDNAFVGEVRQLAEDVKKTMFSARDELVEVQQTDDSAILQILFSLQEKWREDTIVAKKEEVVPDIVSEPESEGEDIDPVPENTVKIPPEDELEETVMLSADQLAVLMAEDNQTDPEEVTEERSQKTAGDDFETVDELEKTVIVNLDDLNAMLSDDASVSTLDQQSIVTPPPKNIDNEDLSETVIISLEELEKLKKGKNGNK
jgi:hypothetical protein